MRLDRLLAALAATFVLCLAAAAIAAQPVIVEEVMPESNSPAFEGDGAMSTDVGAYGDGGAYGAAAPQRFIPRAPLPTLNYNYWYPGQATGYMPARMYLCPRPVPPRVGYTYIPYQALSPHEFLWRHTRGYVRYHEDGSFTTTRVTWR
jgi:hypothetical protein